MSTAFADRTTRLFHSPVRPGRSAARRPAGQRASWPRSPDRREAALIAEVVALATGVPANHICSPRNRSRAAAQARHAAMYLAYVIYQWPLKRVGAAFGRDRTTAGAACRLVEDRRDDPAFDAGLEQLEACLRAAPGAPGVGAVRL